MRQCASKSRAFPCLDFISITPALLLEAAAGRQQPPGSFMPAPGAASAEARAGAGAVAALGEACQILLGE